MTVAFWTIYVLLGMISTGVVFSKEYMPISAYIICVLAWPIMVISIVVPEILNNVEIRGDWFTRPFRKDK